jgi:hypothetical protein
MRTMGGGARTASAGSRRCSMKTNATKLQEAPESRRIDRKANPHGEPKKKLEAPTRKPSASKAYLDAMTPERRDKHREYMSAYRLLNSKRIKGQARAYRKKNRARINEQINAWKRARRANHGRA